MSQRTLKIFPTLLICLFWVTSFAQENKIITGKIKDESGKELSGVIIIEKGTNNGVLSDTKGNFSIEVNEGSILVFSSAGLKPEEKTVGDAKRIELTMHEDKKALEKAVIVNYGGSNE
ncbi:carboxypeptidase-like regulatory domain-containing protein [Formosa sp. S-31]|uniref:carboxypeptidase-like regulatory domain-containing protein n=1 Tax=Formosa sp. S-31 TaxID=2790949 RepID=UPI003EBEE5B4